MAVLDSGLSRELFELGERRETVLDQPSKEALALPYYWLLPRDHLDNIRWRLYVRERCLSDHEFRADIVEMCRCDIAFFAETFGVFFEPRPLPRDLPIKLWADQVDVLAWFAECYGRRDCALEKSRGIGASWLSALFVYHAWLFTPGTKIGMVSKDEAGLDSPDSNSLLGKVAYLHSKMPAWLTIDSRGRDVMHRTLTDHTLTHTVTDATITGFVPTDNKVRSMRFTAMLFDEFAFLTRDVQANMNSSVHTCPSRYFISTWNGSDNAFHTICRREKSTCLVCSMYWWNNSERFKGAYTTEAGRLKILDPSYKYPPDYPFTLDKMVRSPWVDFELRRAGSNVQSALEELYGLQAEGGRKLLRQATLDVLDTLVKPPDGRGLIAGTAKGLTFRSDREGKLLVWGDIGEGKRGPFSAGCDLSFGKGASYSTLEVLDLTTGEQVLEYATNEETPVEFAQSVARILDWLNGSKGDEHTFLSFENNGDQGTTFSAEILRLGYGNVMRRAYSRNAPKHEASHYHGVRNTDGGLATLSELGRAILDGECIPRSAALVLELGEFNKDEKGKPEYPTGAEGHGDRAQGMGIAWQQARERLIEADTEHRENTELTREQAASEIMNPTPAAQRSWSDAWSLSRHSHLV